MKHSLVYTERAVRDINDLDIKIKERIGKTLLRFSNDPLRYAVRLTDPILGSYRFRIGHYRAIFDLVGDEIVILRVGHRREIYKRRQGGQIFWQSMPAIQPRKLKKYFAG